MIDTKPIRTDIASIVKKPVLVRGITSLDRAGNFPNGNAIVDACFRFQAFLQVKVIFLKLPFCQSLLAPFVAGWV